MLAAGGGVALDSLLARYGMANVWPAGQSPYGPLSPQIDVDQTRVVLAIPPGFSYRIVSSIGRLMSDGHPLPRFADGMSAFEVSGFIRLVRNHEVRDFGRPIGSGRFYDARATGGTTTAIIDPATRMLIRDFVSLSGTLVNCAGGATPWNSWLSCEETTAGPENGFEQTHGYVFEVPAAADEPIEPHPLRAMGRFQHEAAVVDPRTSAVFMTEDMPVESGFYRFVPSRPGDLQVGGRLQMLGIPGQPMYDTTAGQQVGVPLPATWHDIPDPDPPLTAADPQPVYRRGREAGGARFRRLEGAVYSDGAIFFASTNGGESGLGQIWRYRPLLPRPVSRRRAVGANVPPRPETAGELTLIYQSNDPNLLRSPDNLTVSPTGSLVICEDAPFGVQHLRLYTPNGELFDLARNVLAGEETSEFAGATFSPDGQTLFVNLFRPSMTLAIWGPWQSV